MKIVINKIVKYAFFVAVISWACVACFWLLCPYEPIVVEPIKIMNKDRVVQQGGTLIYRLAYDKKINIQSTVKRQLVNTYTITYTNVPGVARPGKGVAHTSLPVPKYASPGLYVLRWSSTYQVNPLRSITVSLDSEQFQVIKHVDAPDETEDYLILLEDHG